MTDTTTVMAETAEDAGVPRGAGRVESGLGAPYVHLAFLLGDGGWATACWADFKGLDLAGAGRQVRPVAERIDCGVCLTSARKQVEAVNREVAERQRREAMATGLVTEFLSWAAQEYPHGGAVLAVYAGDTRLHAMRPDERARAIEAWLAAMREKPGES